MWKSKTRCALSSRKWTNDRCKRRIRFVITHTNHSLEPTLSQTTGVRIHFIRTLVHCRVSVARSFTVMEKIPDKERKPDQRYSLAKLGSPLLVVVIVGLIACVIFQFITLASTERRLKEVEKKLNEISKKRSEYTQSEMETNGLLSSSRHRRSANPKTNLSDLSKKLVALESR